MRNSIAQGNNFIAKIFNSPADFCRRTYRLSHTRRHLTDTKSPLLLTCNSRNIRREHILLLDSIYMSSDCNIDCYNAMEKYSL